MFATLAEEFIKFSKQLALFAGVLFGLWGLGYAIDTYVDFTWLTAFFIFIRKMITLFDFAFDTDTLLMLLGYTLAIQVGYWLFKAYASITQFFNSK